VQAAATTQRALANGNHEAMESGHAEPVATGAAGGWVG
jgi:hypothetical protein